MTDAAYNRVLAISGLLGIAVPVSLFVALRSLRGPKNVFQFVSIGCQIPKDCDAQMAGLRHAQSELIRHSHNEMIALTLLAIALLLLLVVVYFSLTVTNMLCNNGGVTAQNGNPTAPPVGE